MDKQRNPSEHGLIYAYARSGWTGSVTEKACDRMSRYRDGGNHDSARMGPIATRRVVLLH